MDPSSVVYWTSPFVILGMSGLICHFYSIFDWKILLANNVDTDQTPYYVGSYLGLISYTSAILNKNLYMSTLVIFYY